MLVVTPATGGDELQQEIGVNETVPLLARSYFHLHKQDLHIEEQEHGCICAQCIRSVAPFTKGHDAREDVDQEVEVYDG